MELIDTILNSDVCMQKYFNNLKKSNPQFEEVLKEQSILNEFAEKYDLNVIGSTKNNFNSVTILMIAPNILREMANDPKKKAYYEGEIEDYVAQQPYVKAFDAIEDNVSQGATIIFKSDGSVVEQSRSVPSPQKLDSIQKQEELKRKRQKELEEENKRRSTNNINTTHLNYEDDLLNSIINENYNSININKIMYQYPFLLEGKIYNAICNQMNEAYIPMKLRSKKLKAKKL